MTLAVVFRRAARREFDEAALWYEARRPGLGNEFVEEINRAEFRRIVVLSVFHARRDPGVWQQRA